MADTIIINKARWWPGKSQLFSSGLMVAGLDLLVAAPSEEGTLVPSSVYYFMQYLTLPCIIIA